MVNMVKSSVLTDFVLPAVLGLAVFGFLTWFGYGILHPDGISVAPEGIVFAAGTATVSATVQTQNLSLTVGDGTIAYGTVSLGASQNTIVLGGTNTQFATNDGNVTETFNVRGVDTANWSLQTAAGANIYFHQFSTNGATGWASIATSGYTLMESGIAVNATATYDFKLGVPTSDSSNGASQDANLTMQATAT